jgi:hypothetical protein
MSHWYDSPFLLPAIIAVLVISYAPRTHPT